MVDFRLLEVLSDICGVAATFLLLNALLHHLQMRRRLDPTQPPGLQWGFQNRKPRAWRSGFLTVERQYRRLYGDDWLFRNWFWNVNLSLGLFVLSGVLMAAAQVRF